MDFVELQLKHGFYARYRFGPETMYSCLIFICCAVHQMKKEWFKKLNNNCGVMGSIPMQKYDGERLMKWCHELPDSNDSDPMSMNNQLLMSFKRLGHPSVAEDMYEKIKKSIRTVRHLKWQDIQCQRGGCDVRRNEGQLKKCKACKVVRYCSRRCQKRAWNVHRAQCQEIMILRREQVKRIRALRPMYK